jgi:hypothetical protein
LNNSLSGLLVTIASSPQSGFEIKLQAETASPSDASIISQLLAAVTLLRSHQEKDDNPDLSAILDATRISSSGTQVQIDLAPSNDQLLGLIEHDTFAPKP